VYYLIEKYAPLSGLGKYNPEIDVSATGTRVLHETQVLAGAMFN
jgi:hypothetical protein